MESRYTARFKSLPAQTGTTIKNFDAAGNLSAHISSARGTIKAQSQNISDLFSTAREVITGITTFQQMHDLELVKNLPAPTEEILGSPSKQLGYVQLSMRFLQAGFLHFLSQTVDGNHRIAQLEKRISELAVYDETLDVIGVLQNVEIEHLEASQARPVSPPDSIDYKIPLANNTEDDELLATDKSEKKSVSTENSKKAELVRKVITPKGKK